MKRTVKSGSATLQAVAIVVVIGSIARGSMPYLPLVGPSPLRLAIVKAPARPAVPVETLATNAPAPVAATPVALNSAVATNNALELLAGQNGPATNPVSPVMLPDSEKALGDTFSSAIFTMPPSDLVGMTPQMLATYFHPVLHATNPVVNLLFPVTFMPPLPPDQSSHAEYNVK